MKIIKKQTKVLKQFQFVFLIITIFFQNKIFCTKNLKSSNSLSTFNNNDPNATPSSQNTNTSIDKSIDKSPSINKYDYKTAVYIVGEVLKKVKTPQLNKDLYEKCIEESLNINADNALKNIWQYFSKIDFKNQEKIKKDPINTFFDEAMSSTDLEIEGEQNGQKSKTKVNCAKSCRETSVGEINDILQSELRDILSPYFQAMDSTIKTKNIITAFIGTYRNTDTGRKLIPKLNLYK